MKCTAKFIMISYFPFQSILLINSVTGKDESRSELFWEKAVLKDLGSFPRAHPFGVQLS